jgi:hypothetical protein
VSFICHTIYAIPYEKAADTINFAVPLVQQKLQSALDYATPLAEGLKNGPGKTFASRLSSIFVFLSIYIHTYIHRYIHIYIYIYIHIHIHTHMHIHIHTHT